MSSFRSRGRAEHFRRMGVTVSWWRPEWDSDGVEASGEPAANNDGGTTQRAPASRGGGQGARGRSGYAVRSRGAEGRTDTNDNEWSTGARQTDNAPPKAFDRPRGGGSGRGRSGAAHAPPIGSSTPMPTQNPDDAWGDAPHDAWATAPADQTSVQDQSRPASRGGASRGRGRGGSAIAPPPTAEADDEWASSTTTAIAARAEQPQPAVRGGRPRPARGAAAWDASSTRAAEPTQRTADDEPAFSIAARGGDAGRGRGRGASGMAPATTTTTRTEEFRHPLPEEGDEWSTSAPPPAGQQIAQKGPTERAGLGNRGGRGRGRGCPDFPASRAPAAARTDWGATTSEPWSTAGGDATSATHRTEPAATEGGRGRGRGSIGVRASSRVEGFQPTVPPPQPEEKEEDEWPRCVSGDYAKPAGGQPAISRVSERSEPGAGRGRGRGGSASAAPAPEPGWWGTASGEPAAITENTGQVARGGARGRGSRQWTSGPSTAATTTAHTEGFQTTGPPPPQEEEEDEWARCVPAVGQQTVPGTQERAEHGARGGPTRRGAPTAARPPTEGYQNEPFGAPQKKDEGAPVFAGSGRGRGRGSSYGERSERGPTSFTQERPSSGFGGGGRQVAATAAANPAGSDDGWQVADKTQKANAPSTRGTYRGRGGESGRGGLVRQFSNDGFPSAIADAGTRGGYRGRGGGGRGRSAASDARQP